MQSRLPAVAALLAAPLLAPAADFCIGGTIVNASTGEPLGRAAVTTPQSATLSDAAGAFRFCGLAAGTYYASGEKPGFASAGLRVTVGPSREDVLLRLQPFAAIKGQVLDANGEPVANALIQLLSITTQNGRRKVKVESAVSTDDRGAYRLPDIPPGRYLIRAAGWQGAGESAKPTEGSRNFSPVYYGGATDLGSAAPIKVDGGRDETADFSVTLEPSYRITGKLANFSPHQLAKIELLGQAGDVQAASVTFHAETGAFEIANVAAGSYLLRATQGEGDQRIRGEQSLQVGSSDVNDVLVPLAAPLVLRGAVHTTSAAGAVTTPPGCAIELSPAGASLGTETALDGATNEEGEFEVPGLLPGRYRVRMDCAAGYIASAHAGETDLMTIGELSITPGVAPSLEAVLSADGGTVEITGTQDEEGEPATAWFALVPNSSNELHIRFAILKGKLSLTGVAPGDYQAYAWTGSPYSFEYANPAARQAWAGRAASVHVAEREHQSVTVKVAPGDAP